MLQAITRQAIRAWMKAQPVVMPVLHSPPIDTFVSSFDCHSHSSAVPQLN